MSAPAKWGSFLSGAVAGLESRLDTILGEDEQASARSRQADQAVRKQARPNDRLQERLAKAIKADSSRPASRASSDLPSRTASPSLGADTTRTSIDSTSKVSDVPSLTPAAEDKPAVVEPLDKPADKAEDASAGDAAQDEADKSEDTDKADALHVPSPRVSLDSARSSQPAATSPAAETPSEVDTQPDFDNTTPTNGTDVASLRQSHEELQKTYREEMHIHLERIDALQSKLKYLANQAATSARAAANDAASGSPEKKLAEKDEQIALLMEEGQALSKKELNYMNNIKKLRAKVGEDEKSAADLKRKLAKAESSSNDATERAKRAEAQLKVAEQKAKQLDKVSKEAESRKSENEEQARTIADLKKQLAAANERVSSAEKKAQASATEADKKRAAALDEELAELRTEKQLAEDRAKSEVRGLKEEATRQAERAKAVETELRSEITNLETNLEVLRARTEEASSSGSSDSQIKLLRQIETLQTQYSLASENWQGIESSLTSRLTALEKERDELAKREVEVRRKAREVNSKARRLEDEMDTASERARALEHELSEQAAAMAGLQKQVAAAEKSLEEAKARFEQQRHIWETEQQNKLDEERQKLRAEMQAQLQLQTSGGTATPGSSHHNLFSPDSASQYGGFLAPQTPSLPARKLSAQDSLGLGVAAARRSPAPPPGRVSSSDLLLSLDHTAASSAGRRTPGGYAPSRAGGAPFTPPQRQDSASSMTFSQLHNSTGTSTPILQPNDSASILADDDALTRTSSPMRGGSVPPADLISASTVAAGPSVQLVERMSAAVRRLESEKAASREETARLIAQRDGARDEVVALLREVEGARRAATRVPALEEEVRRTNERFEATLEMLGEKEERVGELEGDVRELKRIYRDLCEKMQ